jgi:hypothetical protein
VLLARVYPVGETRHRQRHAREPDAEFLQRGAAGDRLGQTLGQFIELVFHNFPFSFRSSSSNPVGCGAVPLAPGFVSARSQAAAGMLTRQSRARHPKALTPHPDIMTLNAPGFGHLIFLVCGIFRANDAHPFPRTTRAGCLLT